jgi:hypothetical protein
LVSIKSRCQISAVQNEQKSDSQSEEGINCWITPVAIAVRNQRHLKGFVELH